jgi:hypothetical protein
LTDLGQEYDVSLDSRTTSKAQNDELLDIPSTEMVNLETGVKMKARGSE